MSGRWLNEALQAAGLGSGGSFPWALSRDVVMHIPVSIEVVPSLSVGTVRRWLSRRGIRHEVSNRDRPLHGCLVARAGYGIVFLDAGDDERERSFTLAHEIAHFVLDHLLPRLRAQKMFGERVLPVLNGERSPTREEMLSAVLERVQLGVQVHLMTRGASGAVCAWNVEESEQRADRLALELLAPAQAAIAGLRKILRRSEDSASQHERVAKELADRFGLPAGVAESYARSLLGVERRRVKLSEEIFGGG